MEDQQEAKTAAFSSTSTAPAPTETPAAGAGAANGNTPVKGAADAPGANETAAAKNPRTKRVQPSKKRVSAKPPLALRTFDASLLVLLRDAGGFGLSAYEVQQRIRRGDAGVLGRTASAVYARLPALKEKGLLEATPVVGRRGGTSTRFMLTEVGHQALESWTQSAPLALPRLDASEMLVRIRAARRIDAKHIWHVFEPLFFELEEKRQALNELERTARREGTWDFSRALELRLMEYQLDAYRMWLDEFRKQVDMDNPLTKKPLGPVRPR